jgi:hypothetical protein
MRPWFIILALACDLAFVPRAGSLPDVSSAHVGMHSVHQKRARSPISEIAFCLGGSKTWSHAVTRRFVQTLVPCRVGPALLSPCPAAAIGISPGENVDLFFHFLFFLCVHKKNWEIVLHPELGLS